MPLTMPMSMVSENQRTPVPSIMASFMQNPVEQGGQMQAPVGMAGQNVQLNQPIKSRPVAPTEQAMLEALIRKMQG
jgi:hypothetical protein